MNQTEMHDKRRPAEMQTSLFFVVLCGSRFRPSAFLL